MGGQTHGSLRDLVTKDKSEREQHHATVQDRVQYLEKVIGDNADKHARELAAHKDAHSKLASEAKSAQVFHDTLEQRIENLERALRDTTGKLDKKLTTTASKVDVVHGKMSIIKLEFTPQVVR